VLLGDVGVGKTTFIRRLVKIDAKQELERSLVFYIDFGSEPALRRDLERYIAETFAKQLEDQYGLDIYEDSFVRAVYNGELNALAKGIYSRFRNTDPNRYMEKEIERLEELTAKLETHLRRSFEHVRATEGRSAVVFFDNIDQREVEFQDAVYLVAQSMSGNWGLTTFVTLRPETFNTSRRSGSLAAYQPRVFTISPPQIDQVVKKRLRFAQSTIEAGSFSLGADGVTLDSSLLRDYIAVLIFSLTRNPDLCECLDNVSDGNVRRALDLLTSFVGSGHVDTEKILGAWRESSRYIIPLHEFLRAIIYGDSEFYDPASSPVPNAYDISSRNPREHFAMPILLNYLHRQAQRGAVELGFVLLAKVYDHFQSLGFTIEDIEYTIDRSVETGLIESSVGAASDRPKGAERLRLRQGGAYLLRRLLRQFVYYDAVVVDTPILSDTVRPLMTSAGFIMDRLDRADRFLNYLVAQFEVFDSLDTGLDYGDIAAAARADISIARSRVLRAEEMRQRKAESSR
jgi:hypothetical protein